MKKIFFTFICILLFNGCVSKEAGNLESPIKIPSKPVIDFLGTSGEVFKSSQQMNITVAVNSEESIENAYVKVYGINSNRNRLNELHNMNLSKGLQFISIVYTTPSCFGCAGITPGPYNITAELIINDELVDSKTVEIEIWQ